MLNLTRQTKGVDEQYRLGKFTKHYRVSIAVSSHELSCAVILSLFPSFPRLFDIFFFLSFLSIDQFRRDNLKTDAQCVSNTDEAYASLIDS